METLEEEQIFQPRELGKQQVDDEFPRLQSESIPKRSKLPLKRKIASVSSLLYPPPRPALPAIKRTLTTRLNTIKLKDEVPDRQKNCKCKQSRCLKLYCLCFSSGKYCDGCCCSNCQNNVENKGARQSSLELILQHNRNAFRAIFINSGECPSDYQVSDFSKFKNEAKDALFLVKYKGCCCKRSQCLQRYCECLHAKFLCSENCKCTDCKNFNGCKEKLSKESKKRKDLDNYFDSNREDIFNCMLAQNQQIVRPAECPLKLTYRSMLEGIIKPQKVREFCAELVVILEAAKDKTGPVNLDIPSYEWTQKTAAQMEEYNRGPEDHGAKPNGPLGGILIDMTFKDSNCEAVVLNETPMSPETLVPMCHEKDMSFHPDASSDKNLINDCYSDIYIEQEKLVLARFLDFLNNLITCGAQTILESNLSTRANREDQSSSDGHNALKTETEMFANTEVQVVEKLTSKLSS